MPTKQRIKQLVRALIGEPYVGKRLKMRCVDDWLDTARLPSRAILDAGSEDATFVYRLADRFPRAVVTAVDIDAQAIQACIEARPVRYHDRVDFRVTGFADLPPAAFDLITIFDVLEHIPDDTAAVRDLSRALRPGGWLLAHVPRNRWRTFSGVEHWVADEDAWRINPGHVRQGYSPEGLRGLLAGAGLEVRDVRTWLGRWGVLAHAAYARLESPRPLRVLSVPVTDVCSWLDRRKPTPEGNTVFAAAVKPSP